MWRRFEATISTDLNLLVKPGEALAKKSTTTGESLFVKATTKNVAVAAADITALGTITTTPLANLLGAFHGFHVESDFQALVTANPTATQLATDVTTTLTNADAQSTTLQTAANQFSTNIATLTTDLSSVKTTFGSFPRLTGTLNGTTTVLKGRHVGRVSNISIVISSEDGAGNIAGTLTDISNANVLNRPVPSPLTEKSPPSSLRSRTATAASPGSSATQYSPEPSKAATTPAPSPSPKPPNN